ncbi:unnamed protein product [Protopolystoma xenopodis]|uniref:IF rod domain-containing protein n=1 Tax=Protopolystoma xenopodis TaxID=117903 RepID=A0A448WZ27_9PLAT|nr:unnamed protein product [Protopolystoma xenopodis]
MISQDDETARRMSCQAEMQSLREELDFQRRKHDEEVRGLEEMVKDERDMPDRELWQDELARVIHDIQNNYDDRLEQSKQELESKMLLRVGRERKC